MSSANSFRVYFYIRRNRNKHNDCSIYCCIRVEDSIPKEICITGNFKRENWDLKKGRPKQSSDEILKLSLYLDQIKAKLFEIYLDLKLGKGDLSADRVKKIYLHKVSDEYSILELIDLAIKKYQTELAPGSLKNYSATKAYVKEFCKEKYELGDVRLKFLTYSFIDELKTYILSHPLKPNDPCTNNGCMKHLERIKKIITWASKMRFIDRDVFASFKIKKNPFESKRLHWQQLKILENRVFQRSLLNLVKDLFIFGCYTGMAPTDVQALKPNQIYTNVDGITWLTYIRAKSKVPAFVPLLSRAIAIINKYQWKKGDLLRSTAFPFVTNKDLNDSLKIISEICELGIALNFYVARYTFATTVTLLNGVPITSIKEMMGHRKIESTMHYAKANRSIIARDMMRVEQRCNL